MYEEHPLFTPPGNLDAPIWRYLDFTKYVSMLENGALFFPRFDGLDDPYEGALPVRNLELPPSFGAGEAAAQEQYAALRRMNTMHMLQLGRSFWCVSCWHQNDCESAAMWSVYASQGQGIALRSSFRRLAESLSHPRSIFIGMVKYLDYDRDMIPGGDQNAFAPLLHKRRSFEHERELRAVVDGVVSDMREDLRVGEIEDLDVANGVLVRADLNRLIERVYVAPKALPWFRELVRAVSQRYDLMAPIVQSDLTRDPFLL